MQQIFRCHRCGWQNVIGQRFCGSCGERFQYNCPYCSAIVDPEFTTCPNCGAELTWGFQEQPEYQPQEESTIYQQQYQEQPQQQYQQYQEQPQQQYQQQYQEQPQQQYQEQKTGYKSKEDIVKQRKKSQFIVVISLIGLLIFVGVAIYLFIKTFQATEPTPPSIPPPVSTDNETTSKPIPFPEINI